MTHILAVQQAIASGRLAQPDPSDVWLYAALAAEAALALVLCCWRRA